MLEGVKLAKEFIESYDSDFVPISELREYLINSGLSSNSAQRVIEELKHIYPTFIQKRGRPPKYFVKSRHTDSRKFVPPL